MTKNKLYMTSEEYEEECGPILFEIADNLRIIAGQLAELNGYLPPEEQTSDYEGTMTMDVDDLPDAIKELFDPKEAIIFMDAVAEAQKKGNHQFKCPKCGGSAEWHEARTNGHIHAWCNKCGIKMFE